MINGNIQSWKQNQVASRYNESNKPIILVNEWNWDWKWCQSILYRFVWSLTFHMFASMQNNLKPSEIMFQFCRQAPLGLPVDQEEAVFHEWLKVPSLSGKNSIFIMSFVYHSPLLTAFSSWFPLLLFFLSNFLMFHQIILSARGPSQAPWGLYPFSLLMISHPIPLLYLRSNIILSSDCCVYPIPGENIMVTPLFPHFWLILFVTQIS